MIINSPIVGGGGGGMSIINIQTGSLVITNGNDDASVDITEVGGLSKAFLLYTASGGSGGDDDYDQYFTRASFSNTSTLYFKRWDDSSDVNIEWQVIECDGISVQHKQLTISSGNSIQDTTIDEVDLAKSFIIRLGHYSDDSDVVEVATNSFRFVNSTTVRAERQLDSSNTLYTGFQVIELE